jgi:hypothetical protein
MSNLEAALLNACDVPELSKLKEPGMEQPNRCGIIIQAMGFIFDEGNGYVCLGHDARINTAVTNVSHLETTLATVLQKPNSIVRRQVAQKEISSERCTQRSNSGM